MSSTIAAFFSSFVIHADATPSGEQPVENSEVGEADSKLENAVAVPITEEEEPDPEDVRVFNAHHN